MPIVPDSFRLLKPTRQGREVKNEMSKALLLGHTWFEPGPKKTWGHLYKLAANHNMKCTTQTSEKNGEKGTTIWFIPIEEPDKPDSYNG